ncbi:hypothetical protein [Maribacter arcticus]
MKSQNSGLCSRSIVVKLFSYNGDFREMEGNVLSGLVILRVNRTTYE